jgi:hypothetical protein
VIGPLRPRTLCAVPQTMSEVPSEELALVTVVGDQLCAVQCTVEAVWPWVGRLYAAAVTKVRMLMRSRGAGAFDLHRLPSAS